jgi:hypothetical protein
LNFELIAGVIDNFDNKNNMSPLVILCLFVALSLADPVPTGGANCTTNFECGGSNAGSCVNGTCLCPKNLANVSCTYKRHDSVVAGALNIALPFVGVGGIGNFIIGNVGRGVGQIILMFGIYIILIPAAVIAGCGSAFSTLKYPAYGVVTLVIIAAVLGGFAGFIWSIIDGANMLESNLNDGNGFALYRS